MASRYLANLSDPDFNVLSDFSYCSEISKLKNKIHRKSSELSISVTIFLIRGTPGPTGQKVYNSRFFLHGSTNSRNAFREAAHIQNKEGFSFGFPLIFDDPEHPRAVRPKCTT